MLAKRVEEYEILEEKEIPQQLPKPKKRRRPALNTHLRSRCFFLLLLLSIMAMLVTVRSGMSASRGYELVKLQQQADSLEKENDRLKIDIAQLKSPQRIQRIATEKLGMVVPQAVYFSTDKKHE